MKVRRFSWTRFFFALTILGLLAASAIFLDTYFLRGRRTVRNAGDPRWRVYDFHSRQATQGEIYDVAEVPAIRKVREVAPRRLRVEFVPPVRTSLWRTEDAATGAVLASGPDPEIPFSGEPGDLAVRLVPEGVRLLKEIRLVINFYPRERYRAAGLSWRDNYWLRETSVPVTTRRPRAVAEWVGLRSGDPELREAAALVAEHVDSSAPALARAEQVFLFAMDRLAASGGTPTDAVQASTPLETCRLLFSGEGRGFCENRALVYYILANAAGVATRLVDVAGKAGVLKLTGHYFCESWIPEEAGWMYVDPQSSIVRLRDPAGRLMTTLDLKRAFERGAFGAVDVRGYDAKTKSLVDFKGAALPPSTGDYLTGYPVLAFKFGYGNTASFNRLKNFLFEPTLLYADFPLPPLDVARVASLALAAGGLALTLISGLASLIRRR